MISPESHGIIYHPYCHKLEAETFIIFLQINNLLDIDYKTSIRKINQLFKIYPYLVVIPINGTMGSMATSRELTSFLLLDNYFTLYKRHFIHAEIFILLIVIGVSEDAL